MMLRPLLIAASLAASLAVVTAACDTSTSMVMRCHGAGAPASPAGIGIV